MSHLAKDLVEETTARRITHLEEAQLSYEAGTTNRRVDLLIPELIKLNRTISSKPGIHSPHMPPSLLDPNLIRDDLLRGYTIEECVRPDLEILGIEDLNVLRDVVARLVLGYLGPDLIAVGRAVADEVRVETLADFISEAHIEKLLRYATLRIPVQHIQDFKAYYNLNIHDHLLRHYLIRLDIEEDQYDQQLLWDIITASALTLKANFIENLMFTSLLLPPVEAVIEAPEPEPVAVDAIKSPEFTGINEEMEDEGDNNTEENNDEEGDNDNKEDPALLIQRYLGEVATLGLEELVDWLLEPDNPLVKFMINNSKELKIQSSKQLPKAYYYLLTRILVSCSLNSEVKELSKNEILDVLSRIGTSRNLTTALSSKASSFGKSLDDFEVYILDMLAQQLGGYKTVAVTTDLGTPPNEKPSIQDHEPSQELIWTSSMFTDNEFGVNVNGRVTNQLIQYLPKVNDPDFVGYLKESLEARFKLYARESRDLNPNLYAVFYLLSQLDKQNDPDFKLLTLMLVNIEEEEYDRLVDDMSRMFPEVDFIYELNRYYEDYVTEQAK